MFDPVLASFILAALIGIPFVFIIVCYASASSLRVAAKWLHFGSIAPGVAFKSVLMTHFATLMIHLSIFTLAGSMLLSAPFNRRGYDLFAQIGFFFTPTYHILALGISLACTALFFCRTLYRGKDEEKLSFQDALTLSALHFAILFGSIFLLVGLTALFVYAVVSFLPFP
ncbi:MAG: hypothetical protein ACKVH8_08340 [Pirellulales bacterium]